MLDLDNTWFWTQEEINHFKINKTERHIGSATVYLMGYYTTDQDTVPVTGEIVVELIKHGNAWLITRIE